jgi:hypothetical protein
MYDVAGAGARTVRVTGYVLTGLDAGNYTLPSVTEVAGTITARGLTVSGLSAAGRVYDGTVGVVVTGTGELGGVLEGEDVVLMGTATGTFLDGNAGEGKGVVLGGLTLSGADAGNYRVLDPGLRATVTRKGVGVTGLTVVNRAFNGGTLAVLAGTPVVSGAVGGDEVVVTGTPVGRYADAAIGTGKVVTVTGLGLGGAGGGNYELGAVTLTGSILEEDPNAPEVTVNGLGVATKAYDGTLAATLTGTGVLSGVATGHEVQLGGEPVALFGTKGAGSGKAVTVSGYLLVGRVAVCVLALVGKLSRWLLCRVGWKD